MAVSVNTEQLKNLMYFNNYPTLSASGELWDALSWGIIKYDYHQLEQLQQQTRTKK